MAIAAGKLRHRVQLQSKTETQSTTGEVTLVWATSSTRWASIEPLQGQELFAAQQVSASVTHRITMRYVANVKPQHRILYGARVFDIQSVLDIQERHKELRLMAREVV